MITLARRTIAAASVALLVAALGPLPMAEAGFKGGRSRLPQGLRVMEARSFNAQRFPARATATGKCFGLNVTIGGSKKSETIIGTAGDDVISAKGGNDVVKSRGGNDTICAGGGSDKVVSGGGIDTLLGQGGNDDLRGGGGNFDWALGGPGNDKMNGGAGDFDDVLYVPSKTAINADMASGVVTGEGNDTLTGGFEGLWGSEKADTIKGSANGDSIYAGGGNDSVESRAGEDFVDGGLGDDDVDMGPGTIDLMLYDAAPGPVQMNNGAGTASGSLGNDTISNAEGAFGSPYDDNLVGGPLTDFYFGGDGNDMISGMGDLDFLEGDGGDDTLDGGEFTDLVAHFATTVPIVADLEAGTVTGDGNDTLISIEGVGATDMNDTLLGDAGDNLFWGLGGNDHVDGRGGTDIILFGFSTTGMNVNLNAGTATGEGSDTLAAIEGVMGSELNDTLIGTSGNDSLSGVGGHDSLQGFAGDDLLDGGAGNDTIDGGDGAYDMVDYFFAPMGVGVNLATGSAFGDGADTLTGVEAAAGSLFDDTITGDALANFLFGEDGNDTISGGEGNDGLNGGNGTNSLDGGDGTDSCAFGAAVACESNIEPPVHPLLLQTRAGIEAFKRHR